MYLRFEIPIPILVMRSRYIQMGAPPVHLLAAAWMGAPASLTCSKLLCPDRPEDRCARALCLPDDDGPAYLSSPAPPPRHRSRALPASPVLSLLLGGSTHTAACLRSEKRLHTSRALPSHACAPSLTGGRCCCCLVCDSAAMRGASINAVRPERCANALEAITRGTSDGLAIALGVASVLISFIGLMAMADGILGALCGAVRALICRCC
jgi:hypothetical protein